MALNLQPNDLTAFAKLGISEATLAAAQIQRVTATEAAEFGITNSNGGVIAAGIIFPYFSAITGKRVTARLRRDNLAADGGKYVCAYGDRRHLYFPPQECKPLLADLTIPVVIVEAEKSVLAGVDWAKRCGRSFLFVGLGGCWGWRGRIGITETAKGERVEEKGPLADLNLIAWQDRRVIIAFDSNTASNPQVRAARWKLADELTARGGAVHFAKLPVLDGVNGPDDLIATCGDSALLNILDSAASCPVTARAEATAAIEAIELQVTPVEPEQITFMYDALAAIEDNDTRGLLVARAAKALRGTINKSDLTTGVVRHRAALAANRKEVQEQARKAGLANSAVDPVALIRSLESFFAERAYLPEGAALLLAFFVMVTWTFALFDSTPYLSIESATPECGKSTTVGLLTALCARALRAMALTEATLFRIVAESSPTLLIDEAECLEGQSERARSLQVIAHEGYKRGAQVPRVTGEDHHIEWFAVFSPKIFSCIGGLTGPMLSRCIVIHMTRCPKNYIRKSTRLRAVERDAKPLRSLLEAYSLQVEAALTKLYEEEPDAGYWPSVTDREAEIWEPLLLHARLAGPEIEAELLEVFEIFTRRKRAIQADDWSVARTIALRDAIRRQTGETFTCGDLIEELDDSEAWVSTFQKIRDDDQGKRTKAIRVGKFLRTFRLAMKREERGTSYSRAEALAALTAHVPEGSDAEPEATKTPDPVPIDESEYRI